MTEILERRAIVSGVGLSRTGRRLPDSTESLGLDAILAAVADAGLTLADIDGISTIGQIPPQSVREMLDLKLSWMWGRAANLIASGAQLSAMINAAMAAASGMCRHVLVYRSVQMMSGELGGGSDSADGSLQWTQPFRAYSAANMFALQAQRHMHLYGTTKEQLGWIALSARYHAGLNEQAAMRSPLTMDDYLAARSISDPLGLLDCDLPIDGAAAFVVSAADYAPDCPHKAVRFEAIGCAANGRVGYDQRPDYPSTTMSESAAAMWARTDLKAADVDVAQLYDGFSFLTLAWLEALGFCRLGEGGPFVEGGARIRLGGELPLNTYGGQLSAGRLHGYWLFHEAVLQLRGDAGMRQVAGAEVAVTSVAGGNSGGCILLTGGDR